MCRDIVLGSYEKDLTLVRHLGRLLLAHPVEFRSPAYRGIIKALGESDAAVEWIEVGIREIQHVAKTGGPNAARQLALSHGVRVNPIAPADLRGRCACLQVLAVYQQIEHFFRSFRQTHPRQVEYHRDADEDPLTATLVAFNVRSEQVGRLEVDLFHYYRIVRNLIMHDPQGNQAKTHKRTCKELRGRVTVSPYSTLKAPNTMDELCFDDFVLFTRMGKQLAANLCTVTNPTDHDFVACALKDASLMKKVRAVSNNRQRCENLIAGFFRERYSIPDSRSRRVSQLVLNETR